VQIVKNTTWKRVNAETLMNLRTKLMPEGCKSIRYGRFTWECGLTLQDVKEILEFIKAKHKARESARESKYRKRVIAADKDSDSRI